MTDPIITIQPGLGQMFRSQEQFQQMLYSGDLPSDLQGTEKMEYIRTQSLALTDELHEALAETGWKPWATSNHINVDAYKSELVDVWIFLMNLMLVVGMAPSELVKLTQAKQLKNIKRQLAGYDGISTKCPGCKRAYDDDAVKCTPMHAGPDGAGAAWCESEGWAPGSRESIVIPEQRTPGKYASVTAQGESVSYVGRGA